MNGMVLSETFAKIVFFFLFICIIVAASITLQPGQEPFAWLLLGCFFFSFLFLKPSYLFARVLFFSFGAFITLRYLLFRAFYTLVPIDLVSFILALILFIAECYAILIHFSGLFVSLYPKERSVPPLPKKLPSIDVFIPTYNEDISVALTTAIACGNFDYPRELITIYILDDGSRLPRMNTPLLQKELLERHTLLKQKAEEIGVSYLTRADGAMAKAGMLNAAFNGQAFSSIIEESPGTYRGGVPTVTTGEFILILDCDHIPSRDMLAKVLGHFEDKEVFLVQTPHFMLNPDPMRKNFGDEQNLPCESWLFYRDVQKGLDRWNAAFFCGSAAFLRREHLNETHGLSGETITEDCETSLTLHAKGYRSVYVSTPLIAGLAPESFIDMIKQRQRWCQGMLQILLLKNPLVQKGLSLSQRLCYLNSCMFWLFPLFRVVFMLAPLMFLLFNLNIYNVSIPQVVAYALPHILSSSFLSAAIHGKLRPFLHSEVLETLQSFFLFPAIFSVFLSPRKPEFKTTRKGVTLGQDALSPLAFPFFILLFLLIAGFAAGIHTWISNPLLRDSIYVAFAWNAYNLCIIICCLGAVWERRQLRSAHRIRLAEPVSLDGIPATLNNLSLTGLRVSMQSPDFQPGQHCLFSSPRMTAQVQIVRTIQNDVSATFTPAVNKRTLIDYVYGDSKRWQNIIDSVLLSRTSYIVLSGQLLWSGFQACWGMLIVLMRKVFLFILCLASLMAAFTETSQAVSFSCSLSSLVFEKKYTVVAERGELRIPFYLSPRRDTNSVSLLLRYKRSSNFQPDEQPFYLTMDGQRVEGEMFGSVAEQTPGGTAAVIFNLPKEKLNPGNRVIFLHTRQTLPTRDHASGAFSRQNLGQALFAVNPETFWTTIDLESSVLEMDYSWKELNFAERKNPHLLFNERTLMPKDVHFVLPVMDAAAVERALSAVHRISLAIGTRPLHITSSDKIVSGKDNVIIADDDAEALRNAPEDPFHVRLAEEDLPRYAVAGRPMLVLQEEKTFKELGLGTITFYPWSSSRSSQFFVPFPITPSPNHYLLLSLNISYGAGLPDTAALYICAGKETLTRVRLDAPQGGKVMEYIVHIPTSLLNRGSNTLIIRPSGFAAGTASSEEDEPSYATIFGTSSFLLPVTGTFIRLPDLSAIFVDGYPFQGNTVLDLPKPNHAVLAAALNMSALITQNLAIEQKPIRLLLPGERPGIHENLLVVTADALAQKNTLTLEAKLPLKKDGQTFFDLKRHSGMELTVKARSPEDVLLGTLRLWEPGIQKQISGPHALLDISAGSVTLLQGESRIFSDLKPFEKLAYYTNNFPLSTWFIIAVLVFLFAFSGYFLVRKNFPQGLRT